MNDLLNKEVIQGIELPAELLDVTPSEIGGWNPGREISASKLVVVDCVQREKRSAPGLPDFVVKFNLSGILCKSYASTIMGVWNSTYSGEQLFQKGNAEGKIAFRDDLIMGYKKVDGNAQFPFQMFIGKKGK